MDGTLLGLGAIVWIIAVVIAILWICMPFALFGTKPILRELLAEQRKTNKLLAEAAERARAQAVAPGPTAAPERFRDY